jgi:hypothetical protein
MGPDMHLAKSYRAVATLFAGDSSRASTLLREPASAVEKCIQHAQRAHEHL